MKISMAMIVFMLMITVAYPGNLQTSKSEIRNFDFRRYLLSVYLECRLSCEDIVREYNFSDEYCLSKFRISTAYADLNGDGIEEAVVQGRSCWAGTAGPDIHEVFSINPKGEVKSLDLPKTSKAGRVLFGNPNYDLVIENNKLIAQFYDTSGRKTPLVIRYAWENGKFTIESIETAPMYQTSYDCNQAKEEHEQAICYVRDLAELDLKLDVAYRKALKEMPQSDKQSLIDKQRQWIKTRNASCDIYKWWVECLQNAYLKRIEQLSAR
jgi:uncharacterized protein YecT (DUF1311 family)